MTFFKFGKRRLAAIILCLGMCFGAMVLYKLIETYNYSELEKNLANQLISSSELVRLRLSSGSQDWNKLLATNLEAGGRKGLDYLFKDKNKVIASNLGSEHLALINSLNLQKISYSDQALVSNGLMFRSSIIRNKGSDSTAYLVLIYQLSDFYRFWLFVKFGLIITNLATFFAIYRFTIKKILPFYRLPKHVELAVNRAGLFGKDQVENRGLHEYPFLLSKSIDHMLHREQEAKEKVQELELEWEDFFKGLPIAAIKLLKENGSLVSFWGANDHLNQIFAPGVLDGQNPIKSIFDSSLEFASHIQEIEDQLLSCYGHGNDEIRQIIRQLPHQTRMKFGAVEKKIFFSWTPILEGGNLTAIILVMSNVGQYGQGQESKQLSQIEYQLALDVIRSGSPIFMKAFHKLKSLSSEIKNITNTERPNFKMQLKIKSLILEIRAILVDAKQDTLSKQLTKLILQILPHDALTAIHNDSEMHDWAQLSPIIRYIVTIASTVADAVDLNKISQNDFEQEKPIRPSNSIELS
ncbi:MAG: hypothetical protein AB8G05_25000 [Oligoflexales bacterium]